MSFEEKGTWLYAVIGFALPVVYFATILGKLPSVAVGGSTTRASSCGSWAPRSPFRS